MAFVFLGVLAFRQVSDWDVGFHLHGAEWIVQNRAIPRTDHFTWSVPDNEYIALHWLFQLVLLASYRVLGPAGLTILNVLVAGSVFTLLLLRLRHTRCSPPIALALFVAAVVIVEIRFQIRPEMLSWAFLCATLLILEDYDVGRADRLWVLPLIQLIWVNAHGLFVLGWVAMGAYALSRVIHHRVWDRRLIGWCGASAMAAFANPYGWRGVLFPAYLFTRVVDETTFKRFIGEFASPWSIQATEAMPYAMTPALRLYIGLSVLTGLLLLATIRRRRVAEILVVVAFFYLSWRQIRNIPLFVLAATPVVAAAWRDMAEVFWPRGVRLPTRLRNLAPIAISVALALASARVITDAWTTSERRPNFFGAGFARDLHPIEAADFLLAHHLDGKLLNDLNTGSWLGWKLPQKVYVDGRLEVMREELFQELSASWASGLGELFSRHGVKLVVFDHGSMLGWALQLTRMPGWRLVHVDARAAVYAAPGYREDVPAVRVADALDGMGIPPLGTIDALLKDTTEDPTRRWLAGFVRRQAFPVGWTNLAALAAAVGEPAAAERLYQGYVRVTRGAFSEALYNLGTLYYRSGRPHEALVTYEAFLGRGGSHAAAQARVFELDRYR